MKMKRTLIFGCLIATTFMACIGDDYIDDAVDPVVQFLSNVDTIAINSTYQFEAVFLNNVGREEEVTFDWSSSSPEVISISDTGLATALEEGSATIRAEYNGPNGVLSDEMLVHVGASTVISSTERTGTIATTSSYLLTGDFALTADGNDLILTFDSNYEASTALPGLYVYLSNNSNTTSGAYEIGEVEIFEGSHSYTIEDVGINDFNIVLYFCKPFNVKVGHGDIN